MKIMMLFFFFLCLTVAFIIMMDLLSGIPLSLSLRNLHNPFWVMDMPEYSILVVILMIAFIPSFVSYIQKRKAT
ncbi:hypothetical protein [Ammoniphilus sp. YIM 78166]|uniref:hypothetical protein n=1 Tax=Ammoniphilus sp. YIM 78166 TaxID=1644106 RepID=UPI00106F7234|nr:hypothetical protein [Ammoniphilus sp. YIM 78166]